MGTRTPDVSQTEKSAAVNKGLTGPGVLFGVPVGDLGFFASLLMGTATGFMAFFGATFLGIVGLMVYNSSTQRNIDLSYSYMRVGLPVGVVVLVIALGYLGTLWVRQQVRRK